jgi:hypothetical protein
MSAIALIANPSSHEELIPSYFQKELQSRLFLGYLHPLKEISLCIPGKNVHDHSGWTREEGDHALISRYMDTRVNPYHGRKKKD